MPQFVGARKMTVEDREKNISFPVFLMYPTKTPSQNITIGPYNLDVAMDAAIDGRERPLIVWSHGGGGTYLVYRTIAYYLAQQGYVVAMPEHHGDNRTDTSLSSSIDNLINRPRHISLTMDALFSDPSMMAHINIENISLVGHSLGGYTTFAVSGVQPWASMKEKIPVTPDPRVKKLVVMAPATGWFMLRSGWQNFKTPTLMLTAEKDELTPKWQGQLVIDLIPDSQLLTFREIKNAAHYSFLSPFPETMKKAGFPVTKDPPGFDREKFHAELNLEILNFLNSH